MHKAHIQQGKVHEALGKTLDDIAEEMGDTRDRTSVGVTLARVSCLRLTSVKPL